MPTEALFARAWLGVGGSYLLWHGSHLRDQTITAVDKGLAVSSGLWAMVYFVFAPVKHTQQNVYVNVHVNIWFDIIYYDMIWYDVNDMV